MKRKKGLLGFACVLLAAAFVLSMATVAFAATSAIHITNSGSEREDDVREYGQTFTPSISGTIDKVDLKLRSASSHSSRTVTAYIYATNSSGLPTGSALATSSSVSVNSSAGSGWTSFTFATPFAATAGVRYAVTVSASGDIDYYHHNSSNYSGGTLLVKDGYGDWTAPLETGADGSYGGGSSWETRSRDAAFQIWMTPAEYTVRFLDWNSTVLKTETVEYGDDATAPANPARTGYTFNGWSPATFANITADLDVTAQYTINSYTVRFLDWNSTVLKTESVNYGGAATAPANPSRTGHVFTGWNLAFNNITGDLDVTAQYAPIVHVVTFDPSLGQVSVSDGGKVTKPADPTRPGYSFGGWFVDPALTTPWDFDNNTITASTTIYAKWTPVSAPVVTPISNPKTGDAGVVPVAATVAAAAGAVFALRRKRS